MIKEREIGPTCSLYLEFDLIWDQIISFALERVRWVINKTNFFIPSKKSRFLPNNPQFFFNLRKFPPCLKILL
jgi:pilus assembly protein TadC